MYNFSSRINTIIEYGCGEAAKLGCKNLAVDHLTLGLLRSGNNQAVVILETLLVHLDRLKRVLENELKEHNEPVYYGDISISQQALQVLGRSEELAKELKAKEADTSHLLLAIIEHKESYTLQALSEQDVDIESLILLIREKYSGDSVLPEELNKVSGDSDKAYSFIEPFGRDMTQLARDKRLDKVIGRDKEISRVIQVLSRRKKNTPVLIGSPGVGKTAIIEGLAQRIADKDVPYPLLNKKIISLDLVNLVAGTKFRGQFEERVKKLLNTLAKYPEIILFIDELHNIVGTGASPGNLDIANILKPMLATGSLQCLGATTFDEYREYIEKDDALKRRFHPIMVEPNTPEETLQILFNIKDKYASFHRVEYTQEALEACVDMAEQYLTDLFFPDKAIDLMDEAGAQKNVMSLTTPKSIVLLEQEQQRIKDLKIEAVKQQNLEEAFSYRVKERTNKTDLLKNCSNWFDNLQGKKVEITKEDIANVVSSITGIPLFKISQKETDSLRNIRQTLLKKIIGQDRAIDLVMKAVVRNRLELRDTSRPIGSFIFLGPTGVGKTQLAKELAENLFNRQDALIRFDMSEYMESFSITRLIGSPPGYVGNNQGGQLTEAVRRKPYSVILFDEIEKAHVDVFNVLLQVLDDGRLTDGLGRIVNFKNTVIIITSNVGTRRFNEFGAGMGFLKDVDNSQVEHRRQEILKKELKKKFAPELLARIDETVLFNPLTQDNLAKILEIELEELRQRLDRKGIALQLSSHCKYFLVEKSYNADSGARALQKIIQQHIEDKLVEYFLETGVEPKLAKFSMREGELILEVESRSYDEIIENVPLQREPQHLSQS